MFESNFLPFMAALALAGTIVYRMSFLQRRKLWNMTLEQIFILVVLPGLYFPLLFSYVQNVSRQPLAPLLVLPERLVINLILLSTLFSYGGVAIHGVTKTLSHHLEKDEDALEVNRFFHLSFSHNMSYGGLALTFLGITLLELNHVSSLTEISLTSGVIKGLFVGGAFALGVFNYVHYTTGDRSRWGDLKVFFMIIWIAFVVLLYSLRKIDNRITEYQLLVPSLLGFSMMSFLGGVLVLRRMKRGGFRLKLRWDRIWPRMR